jgi:ABC-2 type transport system permease protein
MNGGRIKALLRKDLRLFLSNRFFMLITIVGIIFYIGAYFVLPSDLDEDFRLAIYAPQMPPAFEELLSQEGLKRELFTEPEAIKKAVQDGTYQVGIILPPDIMDTFAQGAKPQILIYYSSGFAAEMKDAVIKLVEELCYTQTGQALNIDAIQEILGTDLLGTPIALRDRLRPLLAIFILLVEIMTLAGLISVEIEQGTARALLTTPMGLSDLFAAKGIMGISLALGQAVLFMGLVGGFNHQPLIVLITLLLGCLFVIGVAFLVASLTRDVNAVTSWGMLILVILAVPGFGSVIPGLLSDWAKVIPSFYLTDTINRVTNYNAGWPDVWLNLVILLAVTAVVVWGGMTALRRRYQ